MIRIGIVGCGRILAAHLEGYRLLREAGVDNFRITALCARRQSDAAMYVRRGEGPPQRAPVSNAPGDPLAVGDVYLSDFQQETPVEIFTDYRAMIESGPIDAVNDFTTHALHHQVAQAALGCDKDLLTQKPLAVSVAAGRQMCELAERRNRVLGLFENAHYRPLTRQLHALFVSGEFGQLQLILLNNVGNWWAPDRVVADTPWRHDRLQGGGITLDIGVHLMHQFAQVAGQIRQVQGRVATLESIRHLRDAAGKILKSVPCDADDTMLASFTTETGVIGQLAGSWAGRGQALIAPAGKGAIYYGTAGCVIGDQVHPQSGSPQSLEELYPTVCEADARQRHFPFGLTNPFALNQLDWLTAINERRAPETSGRAGLQDLAAAYALLESHAAGRQVEVAEVLSGALREAQRPIDKHYGLS